MTTSDLVSALAFIWFGLSMGYVGAWVALRFARANRDLSDLEYRFYRDEDINDAADMSTDSDS